MFCYQCEQTKNGSGCTTIGNCGKTSEVAAKQDELVAALISLARAAEGKKPTRQTDELVMQALFATLTNVNFDPNRFDVLNNLVSIEIASMGNVERFDHNTLFKGETDIVSLRSTLLFGLKGMAAYAWHAHVLGKDDDDVIAWLYKGLRAIGQDHSVDDWLSLIMEFGKINLKCLALLDEAHTSTFGHPVPTQVSMKVESGPFIVVTGHDLLDLKQLLDQTSGSGINVYTHGEMLPAHAYPGLKQYSHLKGHYGTAWENQQFEFDGMPASVLFTTNCLMPPQSSYKNNVFTTSVVGFTGVTHVAEKSGKKDFTPVIKAALDLGGWKKDKQFKGINGGKEVTTGFARNTVMGVAGTVIDAVKSGAIKHFFLVGGCDGAKSGRNYYTEFVKNTPANTVVLTLACGKYRFNDLNIGQVGGLPRILDMGQCNDSYSAIQVAMALANAFNCGVNDLPLTLVLSWYEQKAVCILLTLLSLNIKNIYLGPSLPAFISPNVLKVLVEKFNIKPIGNPKKDMQAMLSKAG